MKRSFYFLYVLIAVGLLIGGIALTLELRETPSERAVHQFLDSLLEGDGEHTNFIIPELYQHPFLQLFTQPNIHRFKVLDAEIIDTDHTRVWVELETLQTEIRVSFDTLRGQSHWYLSRLPEVGVSATGIPLEKGPQDKGLVKWIIDTSGKRIELLIPASLSDLEVGRPLLYRTLDQIVYTVSPLQPVALTRVMSLSSRMLEDMALGNFPIEGEFPVYLDENGHFEFKDNGNIPIGNTTTTLYRCKDHIGRMAVVVKEDRMEDSIRVLLQNSSYDSLLHPALKITSDGDFVVRSMVNGIHKRFSGGEVIEFKPSGEEVILLQNGTEIASSMFRWYILPAEDSPLRVLNIVRSHTSPSTGTPYRGTLETASFQSQLTLINEVNLEEYLYSVVPSEMPVSFGLEALKVQSIAARSYAVRSMLSSGYRLYGAHVDDSTASQVYNNTQEQEIAVQAVKDTTGLVPYLGEDIVDARFFSTSYGYTANFHEVWSSPEGTFPADEVPYLTAQPQYAGNAPSLYNEKNFRAFLDQKTLPGYDRYSSFFRWEVTMSRKQLEANLAQVLPALQKTQPAFVLTKDPEGDYQSLEVPDQLGELLNIEVVKRGEGGNIMELEITTTYGIFKVVKEYNIRQALKPVNLQGNSPILLHCHDGTTRRDFPLLPSAFASIDFERNQEGKVLDILIKGGGYGHGVGMSQFGTYGLTLLGRGFDQIIEHYYPGSQLRNIYAYRP